ncbi:MAG: hypothetical protein H2077_05595 [Verrucomicrobiales bacterium]|nr:hypothetical protein [Verrucomicrobiales bacterium]
MAIEGRNIPISETMIGTVNGIDYTTNSDSKEYSNEQEASKVPFLVCKVTTK